MTRSERRYLRANRVRPEPRKASPPGKRTIIKIAGEWQDMGTLDDAKGPSTVIGATGLRYEVT